MMDAIYRFFGSILQFFDNLTGSYIAALALFALLIQIVLLPLAIKQQKNSIKQASLAPKIAAIRAKYKGRTDQATQQKMQTETMELYQKEGFNPAGGCLPLLIQMPIILVLYQVIIKPLSYVVGLSAEAYAAVGNRLVELGMYAAETDFARISQIEVIGKMHDAMAADPNAFASVGELAGKALPNFKVGVFDLAVSPQIGIHPVRRCLAVVMAHPRSGSDGDMPVPVPGDHEKAHLSAAGGAGAAEQHFHEDNEPFDAPSVRVHRVHLAGGDRYLLVYPQRLPSHSADNHCQADAPAEVHRGGFQGGRA